MIVKKNTWINRNIEKSDANRAFLYEVMAHNAISCGIMAPIAVQYMKRQKAKGGRGQINEAKNLGI